MLKHNMLRSDLSTSGWSMLSNHKWVQPFNDSWQQFDDCWHQLQDEVDGQPDSARWAIKHDEFSRHPVLQTYSKEMSHLLHEALPEERFSLISADVRAGKSEPSWHTDGIYLRILFTCKGNGTLAAHSFEDNVITPPGYALVLTGDQRTNKTGIPQTWHAGPGELNDRRLLILSFYGEFIPKKPYSSTK
jgi:hypothetical protein